LEGWSEEVELARWSRERRKRSSRHGSVSLRFFPLLFQSRAFPDLSLAFPSRWKSFTLPPFPPTIPGSQQTTPILASTTNNSSPTPSPETVDAIITTPPPSPYDPASYSYSISSLGPQSPLATPDSGWPSPAWNVAVSIGVADIAAGSACMTPSTGESFLPA